MPQAFPCKWREIGSRIGKNSQVIEQAGSTFSLLDKLAHTSFWNCHSPVEQGTVNLG